MPHGSDSHKRPFLFAAPPSPKPLAGSSKPCCRRGPVSGDCLAPSTFTLQPRRWLPLSRVKSAVQMGDCPSATARQARYIFLFPAAGHHVRVISRLLPIFWRCVRASCVRTCVGARLGRHAGLDGTFFTLYVHRSVFPSGTAYKGAFLADSDRGCDVKKERKLGLLLSVSCCPRASVRRNRHKPSQKGTSSDKTGVYLPCPAPLRSPWCRPSDREG